MGVAACYLKPFVEMILPTNTGSDRIDPANASIAAHDREEAER